MRCEFDGVMQWSMLGWVGWVAAGSTTTTMTICDEIFWYGPKLLCDKELPTTGVECGKISPKNEQLEPCDVCASAHSCSADASCW
jgi:hypothetical protein